MARGPALRRALASALAVVLAAGCAAAPAGSSPVVLDVVMADDWASAPTVRDVIERFEADNDGVRVQVQGAPFSQIPDVLRNAADLGQPYDLAHWHAFAAGANGLAEPVTDLWAAADLEPSRYLPGAVADVTWAGERYGVPLDVNALVLLVDGAVLDTAGMDVADLADADGFVAAAQRLVTDGDVDHAIAVTASNWAAYGWIRAFGGDLLEVAIDGEVTFTFDDPRTVAALDALQQLVSDDLAPAPFAPDLALDAVQAFTQGATAMHASGSWDLPVTRRALDPGIDVDDVQVLPMPSGPGDTGTVLGGSSLFVPVGAAQRDLAFELMLALTADEVALDLVISEGRLPAAASLYDGPPFDADPGLATFVDQLERADVMPLIAYPTLEAAFSDALEAVLKEQASAADALAAVQRRAESFRAP